MSIFSLSSECLNQVSTIYPFFLCAMVILIQQCLDITAPEVTAAVTVAVPAFPVEYDGASIVVTASVTVAVSLFPMG